MDDGSRVYETDLILEEMVRQYEEEKEEEELEAERLFHEQLEEELMQQQEEDDEYYRFWDHYWNGVGYYTKDWYEGEDD